METPPAVAPFDVRLDVVAAEAQRAHLVRPTGTRTVAGRACAVYRSRQSLNAVDLAGTPTTADHVDTCIDAKGLVLSEQRVADGKVTQRREAIAVNIGADAANHRFATVGDHIPLKNGGGRIVGVTDDSRPPSADYWSLAEPPSGFHHAGRFAVVPPQPKAGVTNGQDPTVTEMADVYLRGADVVVIEQGETIGGVAFSPSTTGEPVDAGKLSDGRMVLSARATTVSALASGKKYFVRVSGTLRPDDLLTIARRLAPTAPGTLVTVPDLTSDGA
jgi:hypothetical protein